MTEEIMPDIETPWEWYRELAAEKEPTKADLYAWRGVPGPVIGAPDYSGQPKPGRCDGCGYMETAIGHRIQCGGTP